MKLFWKQFIGILCLVLLLFSIFGSWLLYYSFQMSLIEEKERITEKVRIIQYAVLSSLNSLPEEYEAVDYAVGQIGESIAKSLDSGQDGVRIYGADGVLLYDSWNSLQEKDRQKERLVDSEQAKGWKNWTANQGSYGIRERDGNYTLHSLSLMKSSRGNYYLEINRNINRIYEDRKALYQRYKLVLVVVIAVSALVTFIFSMDFTRPILRLSKETKLFAAGNYERRVRVSGNDEVTALMEDFNEMADQLQDNMAKLKKQARQQEEFTAAFAHELKTPLTSIIGYADMLRMMELPEEDRRVCGNYIFQQGSRLERLSYKMLELVGMDKQKIQFRPVSVKELLDKSYDMMKKLLEEKELQWDCQAQEAVLWGDEDLLLSLLCNLIDNSRKACGEQGKIQCQGRIEEGTYVLAVEDDGRGIPEEELDHIKEAFYMVDKSRARREGGAGIGMALCEKIIQLHQGSWNIESGIDEGTRIVLYLSVAEDKNVEDNNLMEEVEEEALEEEMD